MIRSNPVLNHDHLRNHGFCMNAGGWSLAPAYDMNPEPHGEGLKLNISESDNSQDFGLLREVAPFYRLKDGRTLEIINNVIESVRTWKVVAQGIGLSKAQQDQMQRAFRLSN